MSREVRMVPPDWTHPQGNQGHPRPLLDGSFAEDLAEWERDVAKYREEAGERPEASDYMPEFPAGTATHFCMYETTSEGTPISPPFPTVEELADWLADSKASACGGMTATREQWLAMCRAGSSIGSMVLKNGQLLSGVAAVGT